MTETEDVRTFLRQLQESGEREIIFRSMTAAEARALVHATLAQHPAAAQAEAAPARESARGAKRTAPLSPAPATPVSDGTSAPAVQAVDWRATLSPPATEPVAAPAAAPSVHSGSGPIVITSAATDIFTARPQYETLDELVQAVAGCTLCPLHKAALNPVPGEGNPSADLVCVGEGPGATEDETGRPFVGAAGKLLNGILAAIQLAREDVYICNVVKHRPPGNRTPLPEEVSACLPYLTRQLELVRPRVILALGASAAQTLLNTKIAIGKLRGSVHRYNGVPLIVTYHPAALLRNPAWKRPTWEDVQLVRRILDSTEGD